MKRTLLILGIAGLLSSCGADNSSNSTTDSTASAGKAGQTETKWSYEDSVDKMTSKKKYYATIESDNKLEFEFPYDGGSTGEITVRKTTGSNEVMLSISKGQFNTHSDGTVIKARFDQKKAMTFNCDEAADGSSDVMFVTNPKKFIKELKTAKKVIVQAEFYQSGTKEMEFSTAGFKWAH